MAFDGEYEFVPLPPVTHNAIPEAMKEFISECGMMGILPRGNFVKTIEKETAEVVNLMEADKDIYIKDIIKGNSGEQGAPCYDSTEKNESCRVKNREDEDSLVEKVIEALEENNMGVFKFLEVNGMPLDKAKKFVRRVVRLTLRYE